MSDTLTVAGEEIPYTEGMTSTELFASDPTTVAVWINGASCDLHRELQPGDVVEPISISSDDFAAFSLLDATFTSNDFGNSNQGATAWGSKVTTRWSRLEQAGQVARWHSLWSTGWKTLYAFRRDVNSLCLVRRQRL